MSQNLKQNKNIVDKALKDSKRAYTLPEDYQKQYDSRKDVFSSDPDLEIEAGMPSNSEGWTLV